jgi:hypothetical protein
MATTRKAADKPTVARSATIAVEDTTVENIVEAQKAVGAPDTARVNTGGAFVGNDGTNVSDLPYSVTFSWVE